jgi:hypothetical protein
MWYFILGLYFGPMVVNILVIYIEDKPETVEDLLKNWEIFFIPLVNIFVTFSIPLYYIGEFFSEKFNYWWEKFKKLKIR